jgi:hypothetical protein
MAQDFGKRDRNEGFFKVIALVELSLKYFFLL